MNKYLLNESITYINVQFVLEIRELAHKSFLDHIPKLLFRFKRFFVYYIVK